MNYPVFFKSDYTYPETTHHEAAQPYGKIEYEIHGLKDSERFFQLIHIKPGLHISIYHQPRVSVSTMGFEVGNAPISFSFLVSGTCSHRVWGEGLARNTEYNLTSGTNTVACLHNVSGNITFDTDIPMSCVDLKIDRKLLYVYLRERMARLSPDIAGLLDPSRQVYAAFPLCRQMACTAMEIINPPPYTGVTQALYYESRALNLLALQLEHLTNFGAGCPGCGASGHGVTDPDRIHEARRILVSDLKNPPTIAALARQCGINEFKLKKEFKGAFNTTIFTYLQKVKMEKAWHLLREGDMSVTEAAGEVGYTNISHFAAAFKRQFHINPGTLKKARILGHLPITSEPGKVA